MAMFISRMRPELPPSAPLTASMSWHTHTRQQCSNAHDYAAPHLEKHFLVDLLLHLGQADEHFDFLLGQQLRNGARLTYSRGSDATQLTAFSTSALTRRSRNGFRILCSRVTVSCDATPLPPLAVNHVSNVALFLNRSGMRKLRSAHSSCKLFCSGVPG